MCNVAVSAYAYRKKKKKKLLNRQRINRENRSTLTIKRPQTRTRSQLSERQRDFCTSQPWIWPHIVAPIYFCSRIPRCLCDRRNRWAQRTNAHMRHTLSVSANAYAECTRICSRIIKNTSVLFDQAAAYRPADERGERYLWKRSGRASRRSL